MFVTALFIAALAIACARVAHLGRRCDTLARHKEAWKTYALAVEAIYECDLDLNEAEGNGAETATIERQRGNAEEAAMDAGRMLYDLGEYPEAYGCSPFLPSDPRVARLVPDHIR